MQRNITTGGSDAACFCALARAAKASFLIPPPKRHHSKAAAK